MTAKTTLRIDQKELEQLRADAERNKRSVNQQILWFIHQGLQKSAGSIVANETESDVAKTAETA